MKSMIFRTVSRIHIAAHGREPPSDEEWTAYLVDIKANVRDIDAISIEDLDSAFSYLTLTLEQRRRIREEIARLQRELCEITSSDAAG